MNPVVVRDASERRSRSESRPLAAARAFPFQLPTSATTIPCGRPSARNSRIVRPAALCALFVRISFMARSKLSRVNKFLFGIIRKQD